MIRLVAAAAAALLCAAACRPTPPPLDSCRDPLGGVWRGGIEPTPSGELRRYHVLDTGTAVEIYPMFDDSLISATDRKVTTPDAVIVAPASFALTRTPDGVALVGTQTRRFARGAQTCTLHTPARIVGCMDDRIDLVETPLWPPIDWDRCTPGAPVGQETVLHRERE